MKGNTPSLLIDIERKIQDSPAYEHWAKIFNLKESAKILAWLKENGIDSYDNLVEKASAVSGSFAETNKRLRGIEARQREINEIQK